MNVCVMCKNTTWVQCFLFMSKSEHIKCENCVVCKNKRYIRCYVCEKGKILLLLDNKPYSQLTFEMFY